MLKYSILDLLASGHNDTAESCIEPINVFFLFVFLHLRFKKKSLATAVVVVGEHCNAVLR